MLADSVFWSASGRNRFFFRPPALIACASIQIRIYVVSVFIPSPKLVYSVAYCTRSYVRLLSYDRGHYSGLRQPTRDEGEKEGRSELKEEEKEGQNEGEKE